MTYLLLTAESILLVRLEFNVQNRRKLCVLTKMSDDDHVSGITLLGVSLLGIMAMVQFTALTSAFRITKVVCVT